jgi:hypothetical protein
VAYRRKKILYASSSTHRRVEHSSTNSIKEPYIDGYRAPKPKCDEEDLGDVRRNVAISFRRRGMCNLYNGEGIEKEQERSCKLRYEGSDMNSMCVREKAHDSPSFEESKSPRFEESKSRFDRHPDINAESDVHKDGCEREK